MKEYRLKHLICTAVAAATVLSIGCLAMADETVEENQDQEAFELEDLDAEEVLSLS